MPAFANGTEFPGTGLIFKEAADIAITREDLYISRQKGTVHYNYRSDGPIPDRHHGGYIRAHSGR